MSLEDHAFSVLSVNCITIFNIKLEAAIDYRLNLIQFDCLCMATLCFYLEEERGMENRYM